MEVVEDEEEALLLSVLALLLIGEIRRGLVEEVGMSRLELHLKSDRPLEAGLEYFIGDLLGRRKELKRLRVAGEPAGGVCSRGWSWESNEN